jgi:hypothetical protein
MADVINQHYRDYPKYYNDDSTFGLGILQGTTLMLFPVCKELDILVETSLENPNSITKLLNLRYDTFKILHAEGELQEILKANDIL